MAIDGEGRITTINNAAFHTLGIDPDSDVIGKHIKDLIPETKILDVLETGESQLDRVLSYNDAPGTDPRIFK